MASGLRGDLNLAACLIRQVRIKEATEILEDLAVHDPQLASAARTNLQAIRKLPG